LDQFKGFIGYSEEEFTELWENAIFVVDTNILINFYKYTSKQSTKSLLDILKKLKETHRLWIPHQVALEYFFNYEDNLLKQNEGYDLLGKELIKLKEDAKKTLSTVKSKHPYIMTDKFHFFIDNIEQSSAQLQAQLQEEIDNLPDSKAIQQDLLNLLDGIIGEPYSQEQINAIEKEGKERYQLDVPPGFKDKTDNNKQGFRTYGDFRYQQLYGDLIVWNQIIDRGRNEENTTPIILITEDRKEDWWEKDGQMIKRPHAQLIQEFLNKTQQKFYMFRTDSFVKYAVEYLGADVTEEQAQEVTKEIEQIRKSEEKEETEDKQDIYNDNNDNLEKYSNIDISKLLEYLSDKEQNELKFRVQQAVNDINQQATNIKYNNAIKWAINISIPRLEKKAKELAYEIGLMDYAKAKEHINRLVSLPKEPVEKGMILLKSIEEMQHWKFLQELPF
jgi:hypothetical protein